MHLFIYLFFYFFLTDTGSPPYCTRMQIFHSLLLTHEWVSVWLYCKLGELEMNALFQEQSIKLEIRYNEFISLFIQFCLLFYFILCMHIRLSDFCLFLYLSKCVQLDTYNSGRVHVIKLHYCGRVYFLLFLLSLIFYANYLLRYFHFSTEKAEEKKKNKTRITRR